MDESEWALEGEGGKEGVGGRLMRFSTSVCVLRVVHILRVLYLLPTPSCDRFTGPASLSPSCDLAYSPLSSHQISTHTIANFKAELKTSEDKESARSQKFEASISALNNMIFGLLI